MPTFTDVAETEMRDGAIITCNLTMQGFGAG